MKVNPTVVLTFLLLSMMFGAGAVSASFGLKLGTEALKEVTQPDVRPNAGMDAPNGNAAKGKGIKLLKEDDILKSVKARMSGKATESEKSEPKPEPKPEAEAKAQEQKEEAKKDERFPMVASDRDVSLEVVGVKRQGGSLLLDVSLKNSGTQSVQFLYSFLNVTDDKGRSLSATTEGLPGELPPNGSAYSGTVSIPTALLENAQKLSMSLTDYPDQQLQLQMADIPLD